AQARFGPNARLSRASGLAITLVFEFGKRHCGSPHTTCAAYRTRGSRVAESSIARACAAGASRASAAAACYGVPAKDARTWYSPGSPSDIAEVEHQTTATRKERDGAG